MDGYIEIFLFFGILFYFFTGRATNMVEVLSTRLQEVYAKWESKTEVKRNTDSNTTHFSVSDLRRAGQQLQRKKINDRDVMKRVLDNSLYKIKETEPTAPNFKPPQSFLQMCCQKCARSSRESLVSTVSKQLPCGLNILLVDPRPSFFSRIYCYIAQVYKVKKFDYPRVTQTVLNDERLQEAIKLAAWETANNEGCSENQAMAKAKDRAMAILLQMESRINDTLLRIIAWLLYKLLPCFIQSAIVLPSQIEMLKKANDTGLPLILLPLHRSHLDYVMISFILLINEIRNPLIAAGDNLKIPFFGWLLRGLGAFFIKRRIDPTAGRKDVLYRAILHTYIMESLRAGHNIELFVEGGRTRTGKPCMPKGGILSVIIDAYMDGTIEDALLVPIAMNYERLVDGNFVREQLGQSKKMETFGSTIKAMWSTLMGNYGIVKIDFCQPFSLQEMLKSFQRQQKSLDSRMYLEKPLKYTMSNSSLYGTDVIVEEHRLLVDSIARHVLYDCSKSTPIMSTNLVAFLLLNKFRDGCTFDKLVESFESIRCELESNKKDIAFCGDAVDIINHALDILGPGLVKLQRQEITEGVSGQPLKTTVITAICPVSILPNVIELSYYSNTLLLHYIMDSAIVTALYVELQYQINNSVTIAQKNNVPFSRDDIQISQDALIQRTLKICDILKYEFIFCKPCQDLEDLIIEVLHNLSYSGIIYLDEEPTLQDEEWCKRFARQLDYSSDEDYSRETRGSRIKYKVNFEPEYSARMEFLHTLLRPLLDTYTFSAFTLRKLVGQSLTERDFVQEVLSEIKTNLDLGNVNYGESLCVDPIKNSFKLFQSWNVLECYTQENIKIFYLSTDYDSEASTNKIYASIATFKWII